MIILVDRNELLELLEAEMYAWENVSSGPDMNAYEIDPQDGKVTVKHLKEIGYYTNKDTWIAGIRYKKIREYYEKLQNAQPGAST
jgi:hypothetical protein